MKATARAYTNIALIKYWGKKDHTINLPANDSLSVTLDQFYSQTTVTFDKALPEDEFFLNQLKHTGNKAARVVSFMQFVREQYGNDCYARIESHNHVPTGAGLASSASAFAALACASVKALGLDLPVRELSCLARRGSGSACRSITGGFVHWRQGTDDQTSYGVQLDVPAWDSFRMIAVVLDDQEKKIDSRLGMKITQQTSPYYDAWVNQANQNIIPMISAIDNHDIAIVGKLAQLSAMRMHASLLASEPPIWYFHEETIAVLNIVTQLQQQGINAYYTMDAGPNVKIICESDDVEKIIQTIHERFPHMTCITCGIGPGVEYFD